MSSNKQVECMVDWMLNWTLICLLYDLVDKQICNWFSSKSFIDICLWASNRWLFHLTQELCAFDWVFWCSMWWNKFQWEFFKWLDDVRWFMDVINCGIFLSSPFQIISILILAFFVYSNFGHWIQKKNCYGNILSSWALFNGF